MNILLLGNIGQVGFELQRTLAPLGKVTALDFPDVDFLQLDQLAELVRKHTNRGAIDCVRRGGI